MKCAGNGSLADFFAKHPGGQSTSSDTVNKYSSRAAIAYKEELAKRIDRDERESGGVGSRVTITAPEAGEKEALERKVEGGKSDADFFDTWDKKPATTLKSNVPAINLMSSFGGASTGTTPLNSLPPTPRTQSPAPPSPLNTASALSSAPSSRSSTPPASATSTTPVPTRMTSSSLRTTGASMTGAARPKPSTRTGTGMVLGRGKMGVKKGGTVNFEEAEKRAKEDEERVKRLGYDERLESTTTTSSSTLPASNSSKKISSEGKNGEKNGSTVPDARRESIDTERLGMGMRKLGFGQTMGMSGEESAREQAKVEKAQKRREMGYDDDARKSLLLYLRVDSKSSLTSPCANSSFFPLRLLLRSLDPLASTLLHSSAILTVTA